MFIYVFLSFFYFTFFRSIYALWNSFGSFGAAHTHMVQWNLI